MAVILKGEQEKEARSQIDPVERNPAELAGREKGVSMTTTFNQHHQHHQWVQSVKIQRKGVVWGAAPWGKDQGSCQRTEESGKGRSEQLLGAEVRWRTWICDC